MVDLDTAHLRLLEEALQHAQLGTFGHELGHNQEGEPCMFDVALLSALS